MNHVTDTHPSAAVRAMQPMAWGASLLYFGLPAAALFAAFHGLMPWLMANGMPFFYAYALSLGLPLAAMLVAALVATRREGYALSWVDLQRRWRLRGMNGRLWLWTIAAFVVALVAYYLLGMVQSALTLQGIIPIPDGLPAALDPRQEISPDNIHLIYGNIQGDWPVLFLFLTLLFFNIVGEEVWWRGYVLPRQELAFGQWTWLVHGLMWNLFHIFKWWDLIALLPVTLLLTFLVVRLRNNTPGLIFHALFNGLAIPIVIMAIMG